MLESLGSKLSLIAWMDMFRIDIVVSELATRDRRHPSKGKGLYLHLSSLLNYALITDQKCACLRWRSELCSITYGQPTSIRLPVHQELTEILMYFIYCTLRTQHILDSSLTSRCFAKTGKKWVRSNAELSQ